MLGLKVAARPMRILFLTHPYPNYVPDLLLHGLRSLLGPDCVDYPRKDCVYEGVIGLGVCPEGLRQRDWFPPDRGVDREDVPRRLALGDFDYAIVDVRALAGAAELLQGARVRGIAVVDGEDRPVPLRPGPWLLFRRETDGCDHSVPLPMALPAEVFERIRTHDGEAKRYPVGFVGAVDQAAPERAKLVEALRQRFPDGLFRISRVPGPGETAPGRLHKDDYYRAMQACRFTVTLPGAGRDTFRYWEHAACNSVDLAPVSPLFIPDDFEDGRHLLRFTGLDALAARIERLEQAPDAWAEMVDACRSHLLSRHLTIHRAAYCLDRLQRAFAHP